MRKLAVAAIAAGTLFTTGAYAQVGVNVGPGGVSVGVGEPGYHRHYRDDYRHRDRRDWRDGRAEERVIIKERRDGSRKVIREYRD